MTRQEAIEILKLGERFRSYTELDHQKFVEAYEMAIKSLEVDENYDLAYEDAKAAGQWIDVHDKMPEGGRYAFVLTCDGRGFIDVHSVSFVDYSVREDADKFYSDRIVAWMPLPEPYKGVNHEEN